MANKLEVILRDGSYRVLDDLRWLSEGDAVFSKGRLLVVANDCDYDHLLSFIRLDGEDIVQWTSTLRNTTIDEDGMPKPIDTSKEFFEAKYVFGEPGQAQTYKVLKGHYEQARSRKEAYDNLIRR